MDPNTNGIIAATVLIGVSVGAFGGGLFMSKFGKKGSGSHSKRSNSSWNTVVHGGRKAKQNKTKRKK